MVCKSKFKVNIELAVQKNLHYLDPLSCQTHRALTKYIQL
jgi:hypothetical protein